MINTKPHLNLKLNGVPTILDNVITIPLIAGAGSSVQITKVSATDNAVSSIKFTCGADNNISYPFSGFDGAYVAPTHASQMPYIEFTSSNPAGGIQFLGNSVNTDTSVNLPFVMNESFYKTSPFVYLAPVCATNAAALPILETVVDSITSCCHFEF